MNITSSNLSAMIALGFNPTQEEWDAFKCGLKNYLQGRKKMFSIPLDKFGICRRKGCEQTFVKWSWNAVDCEEHRRKSLIKYPEE